METKNVDTDKQTADDKHTGREALGSRHEEVEADVIESSPFETQPHDKNR